MAQAKRSKQSGKPAASRRPSKKGAAQERVPSYVWMLGLALLAVFITLSLLTDATGTSSPPGGPAGFWGCWGSPLSCCPYCCLRRESAWPFQRTSPIPESDLVRRRRGAGPGPCSAHLFRIREGVRWRVLSRLRLPTLYRTAGELTLRGVLGGLIRTPPIMLLDKIGAGSWSALSSHRSYSA